jgi:hypothetical protein
MRLHGRFIAAMNVERVTEATVLRGDGASFLVKQLSKKQAEPGWINQRFSIEDCICCCGIGPLGKVVVEFPD